MAEAPVTTHAASSPTAHSWSSRARRCRHHLATLTRVPPRGAVYGRSLSGLLKKLQDFPGVGGRGRRAGVDVRVGPTAAGDEQRLYVVPPQKRSGGVLVDTSFMLAARLRSP